MTNYGRLTMKTTTVTEELYYIVCEACQLVEFAAAIELQAGLMRDSAFEVEQVPALGFTIAKLAEPLRERLVELSKRVGRAQVALAQRSALAPAE